MTAYSTLVDSRTVAGSIKNWCNQDNIPATTILTEAEAWIYERLRVRGNVINTSGTLSSGGTSITLGADFRGVAHFQFTGTNVAHPRQKMLDFIRRQQTYTSASALSQGQPSMYAVDANSMVFEVAANQAYAWMLDYFGALPALSTATETNMLTERYPTLLRHVCLAYGMEWRKNEKERLYYLKLAENDIQTANFGADLELAGIDLQIEIDAEGEAV